MCLSAVEESLRYSILNQSLSAVVSEHILERIPYVFNDDWALFREWRSQLAIALEVDPCDLAITGSACVGVSVNPHKNFSHFSDSSDIDVAVISPHHFDIAWRRLRAFNLADAKNVRERNAVISHRQNYIYWGCIATDRILSLMSFSKQWLIASSNASAESPVEGRDVTFRIYRDYDSLRSYQIDGMKKLRAQLLQDDGK